MAIRSRPLRVLPCSVWGAHGAGPRQRQNNKHRNGIWRVPVVHERVLEKEQDRFVVLRHCDTLRMLAFLTEHHQCALTTGSCGHRRQRAMFPDTFVAGAAHPDRYTLVERCR